MSAMSGLRMVFSSLALRAMALFVFTSALLAHPVRSQYQDLARTRTWPDANGVPSIGDTLQLRWSAPNTKFLSKGSLTTMELRFDHRDLRLTGAQDVEVVMEAKATMDRDPGGRSSAPYDSLFTLTYRIGKRPLGAYGKLTSELLDGLDPKLAAQDRQLFTCAHVTRIMFELVSVRVNAGTGFVAKQELPPAVLFDVRHQWMFLAKMAVNVPPAAQQYQILDCSSTQTGPDELLITWGIPPDAVECHLEWTWVDDYDANGTPGNLQATDLHYDLAHNSTRVTVTEGRYRIPLLFDSGWIIYRIRGVGRIGPFGEHPSYGPWSSGVLDAGNVGSVPNSNRVPVPAHRKPVNWQLTSTFAEEGKRKEVMTYADGTLRTRQTVTRSNSLLTPIIGETFYDVVGRPAVESMPVPMVRPKGCPTVFSDDWAPIDLYPLFNQAEVGGSATPYTYEHMVTEGDVCGDEAVPFHRSDGAELYYHPDHLQVANALTGKPGFLPRSEGYPFMQTEYTRDNTGRVRSKSGVGPEFRMGESTRPTRYLYGKPEQTKLDRMFGSEAGYATHYQKNAVIDANGQASISYIDGAGRTVATSLAGGAPAQLMNMAPFSDPQQSPIYRTDLFGGQPSTTCEANAADLSVPSLTFRDQIIVPANGLVYQFKYDLTAPVVSDPCLEENVCLSCDYIVEFSLVDACGTERLQGGLTHAIGSFQLTDGALSFSCVQPGTSAPITLITGPLEVGEYALVKTLSVDAEARAAYVNEVLNNGGEYLAPGCYTNLDSLIAEYVADLDLSGCDVTCVDCYEGLGTLEEFLLTGGTVEEYELLMAECDALCQEPSWCEVAYTSMLTDMSLGGQYATYELTEFGDMVATDRASVFYFMGASDPSVLAKRGMQYTMGGYGYAQPPSFPVPHTVPLWRQPRFLVEDGSYVSEYRVGADRITIPVMPVDGGYTPAVLSTAQVFQQGGSYFTYPENLATLELFITYWRPGFERSLVYYHPEYCYWTYCRGFDEGAEEGVSLTSDGFDERLRHTTFLDAIEVDMDDPMDALLIDRLAPAGERVLVVDHDGLAPAWGQEPPLSAFDPYLWSEDYGPGPNTLQQRIRNYTIVDGGSLSMEMYAAYLTRCPPGTPLSACPQHQQFAQGVVTDPEDLAIMEQEWAAYKSFYFSEKLIQQKAWMDGRLLNCGECVGVNYCIGQGENDAWKDRMQAPVTFVPTPLSFLPWGTTSPYDTPGLMSIYMTSLIQYAYEYGRPIRKHCQACSDHTSDYFVNKVPRFPDPQQFPGMDMDADELAYQNWANTGDCPAASGLRALLDERVLQDQLTNATAPLAASPGWIGLNHATNGTDDPVPQADWVAGPLVGNTVQVQLGTCLMQLSFETADLADFPDLIDRIFSIPTISATTATTFTAQAQFAGDPPEMLSTTITGQLFCTTYDLVTCDFPQVGTGNEVVGRL
jgi:hypothetical protein